MSMIFDDCTAYEGSYTVKEVLSFTPEEKACIIKAYVRQSEHGHSVCFLMKSGVKFFIPVSRDSVFNDGDEVNLDTSKVLVLSKPGSKDIKRVDIRK